MTGKDLLALIGLWCVWCWLCDGARILFGNRTGNSGRHKHWSEED